MRFVLGEPDPKPEGKGLGPVLNKLFGGRRPSGRAEIGGVAQGLCKASAEPLLPRSPASRAGEITAPPPRRQGLLPRTYMLLKSLRCGNIFSNLKMQLVEFEWKHNPCKIYFS